MSNPDAQGRPKGSPNKYTTKGRDCIWEVFRKLGDVEAMAKWAEDNKTDFYTKIFTKLLPLEVRGTGFVPLPEKVTKADTDREFAKKVLFVISAGIHDNNSELLKDLPTDKAN